MEKGKLKKGAGIAVDVLMFVILLVQMLYVFTGNTLHEILGIGFFVCLAVHIQAKVVQDAFQRHKKACAEKNIQHINDTADAEHYCSHGEQYGRFKAYFSVVQGSGKQ